MKANIRSLKVDLPIDLEELASPLPDGARFNWSALMPKIVAPASVEAAPSSSKPKFPLIRSPLCNDNFLCRGVTHFFAGLEVNELS